MFGFVIISKRKLKEVESDAYNRGFQVARSVGYSEPTFRTAIDAEYRQPHTHGLTRKPQAGNLRTVTGDNAQAVVEMHKRVDAVYNRSVLNGKRRHNRHSRVRASYADPNLQLIAKGASVKDYIFKHIGKLTHAEMAKHINKNMGTHVRGAQVPIKVDGKFVGMLLNRALVWDEDTNTFINLYYRNKKK